MAAIQAANNDLEQSLASITAELDSLRSLQTHVQRLETHMAAVCSSEEDRAQEARDRAAASMLGALVALAVSCRAVVWCIAAARVVVMVRHMTLAAVGVAYVGVAWWYARR